MRRPGKIAIIIILVLGIGFLHYSCQLFLVHHTQWHNVFLRFFYVPIILAAYWWGLRGGGIVASLCAIIYSIDVFRWWNPESPEAYNRFAEIILFLGVGTLLGYLVDSDRRTKREKKKAEERAEVEHHHAITDSLTKAFNRRHLEKTLREFWEMARQGGAPFSLLMIDLNGLKSINDHYGHSVGDRVLQSTVQTIFNNCRKTDLVFRYGGDEFLLLLPMTPGSYSLALATRLREEIAKLTFRGPAKENFKADFSIGIIEFRPEFSSISEMLGKLDEALYRAKKDASRIALAS